MGKPTRSQKNWHLGFKYIFLCVSKLEVFTQLLPVWEIEIQVIVSAAIK